MNVKIKTNVVMPFQNTKILELNQYQKSEKNYLLFKEILNVQQKILMGGKTIMNIYTQQK